jgi:C_GCAxxG_C_C family probable redox protein
MTKKEKLVHAAHNRARELFDSKKHNCSESAFMALNEVLGGGLEPQTAAHIATGLGGGLGASGGTCGALTGCVLALGLLAEEDPALPRKKIIYPMAAGLQESFRERFGSCCCRDLTRDKGDEQRAYCSTLVADAAKMCAEMLLADKKTPAEQE